MENQKFTDAGLIKQLDLIQLCLIQNLDTSLTEIMSQISKLEVIKKILPNGDFEN
jgi:hypothetical protein